MNILNALKNDENGFVVSAELVLVGTICVLGMIVGLSELSFNVNQELEEGLISLAAPLTNRAGRMVAALNLSGQANRTSAKVAQDQLLPSLLASARHISSLLSQQT